MLMELDIKLNVTDYFSSSPMLDYKTSYSLLNTCTDTQRLIELIRYITKFFLLK